MHFRGSVLMRFPPFLSVIASCSRTRSTHAHEICSDLETVSKAPVTVEVKMSDDKFLTPDEVSERYRGSVTVGTLRNWRAMRVGPTYIKIGKAVLYPIRELDACDEKNTVTCRDSKNLNVNT